MGGVISELGLATEMEAAFAAAGITTQVQLAELGFDSACDLPGVWRAGVKGAFDGLAKHLYPRYREAASLQLDGDSSVDDDAEISWSSDGGAYVQAWVWVSNEELETT